MSANGPRFRLCLVTDRAAVRDGDLAWAVARALAGAPRGAIAVQLREEDLEGRELLELARRLRDVTRAAGAPLLVNDRIDVALAAHADGVHLPRGGVPVLEARRLLGSRRLLAVSTDSPAEVEAAAHAGADLAVFGPVFPNPSPAPGGPPQGLEALRAAAAAGTLPVFATGGIDPGNAGVCRDAGAAGVAVTRAVLAAEDPAAMIERLHHVLCRESPA